MQSFGQNKLYYYITVSLQISLFSTIKNLLVKLYVQCTEYFTISVYGLKYNIFVSFYLTTFGILNQIFTFYEDIHDASLLALETNLTYLSLIYISIYT